MFPDELRVSSFPDRFPHSAWTAAQSAHSYFDGSRVYACLGVTCHLHFWQNDRGLLRATAVTRERTGHRIRVSTQNLLWRRKFSRRSCRDSNSQPFDHESGYPGYDHRLNGTPLEEAPFALLIRIMSESVGVLSPVYHKGRGLKTTLILSLIHN